MRARIGLTARAVTNTVRGTVVDSFACDARSSIIDAFLTRLQKVQTHPRHNRGAIHYFNQAFASSFSYHIKTESITVIGRERIDEGKRRNCGRDAWH